MAFVFAATTILLADAALASPFTDGARVLLRVRYQALLIGVPLGLWLFLIDRAGVGLPMAMLGAVAGAATLTAGVELPSLYWITVGAAALSCILSMFAPNIGAVGVVILPLLLGAALGLHAKPPVAPDSQVMLFLAGVVVAVGALVAIGWMLGQIVAKMFGRSSARVLGFGGLLAVIGLAAEPYL